MDQVDNGRSCMEVLRKYGGTNPCVLPQLRERLSLASCSEVSYVCSLQPQLFPSARSMIQRLTEFHLFFVSIYPFVLRRRQLRGEAEREKTPPVVIYVRSVGCLATYSL